MKKIIADKLPDATLSESLTPTFYADTFMRTLKGTTIVQLLEGLELAEPEPAILEAWYANQFEAAKATLSRYSI